MTAWTWCTPSTPCSTSCPGEPHAPYPGVVLTARNAREAIDALVIAQPEQVNRDLAAFAQHARHQHRGEVQ